MIFFLVFINLLITLFNIYIAIKIWQSQKIMAVIKSDLANYESLAKSLLINADRILNQQQTNIAHVRQQYQALQLRLQKTRQAIILISWLYRIGGKYIGQL